MVVVTLPVQADSWELPKEVTYWSPAHSARLTVTPGTWEERRHPASGRLDVRRPDGTWRQVWRRPLLNDVAPVEVVVADDGRHVVTLDEWFRLGFGPNVVVLYGHDGNPTRALSLDDFLPANYIAALPHSISSIHWRAAVSLSPDGRSVRIPVAVPVGPCGYPGGASFVDFTLQFESGALVPPASVQWASALSAAARSPAGASAAGCGE